MAPLLICLSDSSDHRATGPKTNLRTVNTGSFCKIKFILFFPHRLQLHMCFDKHRSIGSCYTCAILKPNEDSDASKKTRHEQGPVFSNRRLCSLDKRKFPTLKIRLCRSWHKRGVIKVRPSSAPSYAARPPVYIALPCLLRASRHYG